jgi:hypothetical protein
MRGSKFAGTTDHGFFEERLSAYLDGELTPREHKAVQHHLETCPACQWDLDTLEQTIQWTRELPALTVPRVFTIPVPPEPVRSPRRWNFLPILQGATALIAVLLVFAVAGDLVLGPLGDSQAPNSMYQREMVSSDLEVTKVVEKVLEAPAAVEAETGIERTVVETVVVESEMVVTQTEAPMALRVSPTEPTVGGEGIALAATPSAPAAESAWKSGEEAAEEVEESAADAGVPEPEAAIPPAEEAVAGGGEPALTPPAPSPPPSPSPSVTAPTVVAFATELALAPAAGRDEAATEASGVPGINWLRVVEVSLGAALIVLAAATIFLTIERRRAR